PTHAPPTHVSPVVQLLPSLQGSLLATKRQPSIGSQTSFVHAFPSSHVSGVPGRHVPSAGLHVSVPLQTSASSQTVGVPTHAPATHVSPVVHALLSSHGPGIAVYRHPKVSSQTSSVHGLPSSQFGGVPGTHDPVTVSQVSTPLHAIPSSQTIGVPTH